MSAIFLCTVAVCPALCAAQLLSPQFFNATLAHGVDVNIWGATTPNTEVQVTVGVGSTITAKVTYACILLFFFCRNYEVQVTVGSKGDIRVHFVIFLC